MLKVLRTIMPGSRNAESLETFRMDLPPGALGLTLMIGICNTEDEARLNRIIFRISRGNAYYNYFPI
jgi:hypothetical protein